jgi:hypothetical protein
MPASISRYSHPKPFSEESSAPRRQLDGGVPPAADGRGGGQTRPSSVVPSASVLLSGPGRYWPRRRLPAGASSRSRAVGRPRHGRPGQQARHGVGRRYPACGVHHPVSASGNRLSSRPVSGHLGSSSSESSARPSAVHPSSIQPSAVQPSGVQPSGVCPRRSGHVRILPCSGGGVGTRSRWPDDPDHQNRWGPGGCRAVDGSIDGRGGRDAGDAAELALVSGRSLADLGRRVGCGPRRPRLPAERPGRPGRRSERPSRAAVRWARGQAAARGGGSRRVAGVLGLGTRPR